MAVIYGTKGNDTRNGTEGNDTIYGSPKDAIDLYGADTLNGNAGNDSWWVGR